MAPPSPRRGMTRLNSMASKAFSPESSESRGACDVSAKELLQQRLGECPLIAIIRGVTPDEAEAIGDAIYEGGIRIIEVPLNSPDPLNSIERLAAKFGERMLVGAGTVLNAEDVARVKDAGGGIIVSP